MIEKTLRTTLYTATILCAMVGPAFADKSIDFSYVVVGDDHKPYTECAQTDEDNPKKCLKTVPITLGSVSATAVSVPDKTLSLAEQLKRGALAQDLAQGKKMALTSEQISLIKDQLGKMGLPPIFLLHVVKMLDPNVN